MKRKTKIIIIICASIAALLLITGLWLHQLYRKAASDITIELGEMPKYTHITEDPILSRLCSIETDLNDIDTYVSGKYSVDIEYLGIWSIKSTLTVESASIPELISRKVLITCGAEITADMFVSTPDDLHLSFRDTDFDTATAGEYEVHLSAQRDGGKPTNFRSTLTVYDPGDLLTFEYGRSTGAVTKTIHTKFREIEKLDTSAVGPCGRYPVKCYNEDTFFLFEVTMLKATARDGKVLSFDIIAGDSVTEADILGGIGESDGMKTELSPLPDFNVPGDYEVKVTLTDKMGAVYEQISNIRVHHINSSIRAEVHSTNDELSALIFKDDISPENLEFANGYVTEFMEVGDHNLFLRGEYSTVTVKITVEDTVAPVISLKDIDYPVDNVPTADKLVEECTDESKVRFSFSSTPDSSKTGKTSVTVIATDAGGNTASGKAYINFVHDTEPPKIYGAYDMTVTKNSKPRYMENVYAEDGLAGRVAVSVDSSAVNTHEYGAYELIYYATDLSGNKATVTVTVTVSDVTERYLDVKNIMQYPALPNGCEVTSLAIVLNYLGYEVDPVWLCDNHLPMEDFVYGNPWKTYVGNPKNEGLGCYAPAIVEAGNSYLESVGSDYRAVNVSGGSLSDYEKYIDRGVPVILWGTMYMNCDPEVYWTRTYDGVEVVWHASSHCLVLMGYDEENYIFCDPMRSGIVKYSRESVITSSEINFRQACVIE